MTEYTAVKPKPAAGNPLASRCLRVLSKLKSWTSGAIELHHERVVSLRVHGATRLDGLDTVTRSSARVNDSESRAAAASDDVKPYTPRRRLLGWFAAVYAAHVARLIALRVYDHRRV